MPNRIIHKEIYTPTDLRLGRHINYDSKNLGYAFDTTNIEITDVEHICSITLNQGNVASCVGNACIAALNTAPYTPMVNPIFQPDEDGAQALYSACEEVDGDGPFPPNDHGTSVLSACKVLSNPDLKIITSYQWAFTLQDALKALTKYPIVFGTNWYQGMGNPSVDGQAHITGDILGGHCILGYKIDTENGRVWFHNWYGKDWGVNGDFFLSWEDFETLLSQQGEVAILIQ